MKIQLILAICAIGALPAQNAPANPLSTEAQQAWTRTMGNIMASVEKMPETNYEFKPTPESMSFRDLVAHTIDSAMNVCAAYNGERKSAGAAKMQTKAELSGAAKVAQAECEKAYGSLTDTKALEMIAGRMGSRTRLSTLWGNTVHIEHEYAQMAVHLRLKGLVPPSTAARGAR